MARKARPLLTDQQWALIEPLLPQPVPSPKGGRKRIDNRRVVEGILWILRSGARWQDLPDRYPSPSTCWRRLRDWEEQGVWVEIWRTFLADLDQAGWLDWEEAFVDASFFPAKKGANVSQLSCGSVADTFRPHLRQGATPGRSGHRNCAVRLAPEPFR